MSRIFLLLAKATVYGKTNSESIPIRPVGIQVPTGVLPGGTEITEILPEIASETFTYDLNANITRLLRKAVWGRKSTPAAADDLTMAYDGNRLSSLTDNAGEVLSEALPDIPSGHSREDGDCLGRQHCVRVHCRRRKALGDGVPLRSAYGEGICRAVGTGGRKD